jgi:hypothetical protein
MPGPSGTETSPPSPVAGPLASGRLVSVVPCHGENVSHAFVRARGGEQESGVAPNPTAWTARSGLPAAGVSPAFVVPRVRWC